MALEKARQFLDGYFPTGMIWIGGVGTGKSHLAAGIIREWIETKGKSALYTTASNAIEMAKSTFNGNREWSSNQVDSKFLTPSLLVIDEVGIGYQTEFEYLTLSKICLRRFDQCRATILISNLVLNELAKLVGERVIDRFREDGDLFPFNWASWRGRPMIEEEGENDYAERTEVESTDCELATCQ
ncbi:MAG: ATP-binding protein [Nitrospira sp.]|nr:ATP-binding protein [Nitrospira sp.]